MVFERIYETIGNTPIVKISKLTCENCAEVYAKLEYFNPGGSIKDRIALYMIEGAEKEGLLQPGGTVIEPTSGNTGIGLALVCASKGYRLIIVMPESMSVERRQVLKAYGAEIILTPASEGMTGAIRVAEQLARENGYFMPLQFENKYNPLAHRETTALEILRDMDGKIDAFVAGVGTGGTITGVGEVLKEKVPGVKIVAVEPEKSALLSGGTHSPHKIQGIGPGFIPKILNRDVIDEVVTVSDESAFEMTRRLAKEEGLFVGISSGAAMVGALKVAEKLGKGKRVVVILPDGGSKYLSMNVFDV
ncbi:cysteine synthase [Fervidobacterium pennivorans DSM 9078]|uniref:Cysteine synthase n=1 Tax=Fervidobacterium pennivorans (strain DSM 9078 / Ven5) TaxID=771875 RepID=H9UBD7_FERPD|nr:cysteine synthase A [Fervidobacterium pennivorans]AFG34830.1 cysteine synthase [Fervidobacterium pennivorans DSM 9078]